MIYERDTLVGSSGLIPEITQEKVKEPLENGLVAGVTDYGYDTVGASSGDLVIKSTGWNISEKPTVVICQSR